MNGRGVQSPITDDPLGAAKERGFLENDESQTPLRDDRTLTLVMETLPLASPPDTVWRRPKNGEDCECCSSENSKARPRIGFESVDRALQAARARSERVDAKPAEGHLTARERAAMDQRLNYCPLAPRPHLTCAHGDELVAVDGEPAEDVERLATLDDIERVRWRTTDQLRSMLSVRRSSDADVPTPPSKSLTWNVSLPNLRVSIRAMVRDTLANTGGTSKPSSGLDPRR